MAAYVFASLVVVVVVFLNSITSTSGHKELEVLSAGYKHLKYDFSRYWSGQVWHGVGELWVWFAADNTIKIRFDGEVWNQVFGAVKISTFIDSVTEQLHVNFHFKDLNKQQCVTYPYVPRANIQQQIDKLMERDRCELAELGKFDENFQIDSRELHLHCPGTAAFILRFSPEGILRAVDMRHDGKVSKSLNFTSVPTFDTEPGPGDMAVFAPPSHCELYSKVDDPLARLKFTPGILRTPAKKSSTLSDMLLHVSKKHIARMMQSGHYSDTVMQMREMISLAVFTLPGDIIVLMSEPKPPNLNGINSLHFEYTAVTYQNDREVRSNGQVWLNMTTRSFRHTALQENMEVDLIARAEPSMSQESMALQTHPRLQDRLKNPVLFYRVDTGNPASTQNVPCVTYSYPGSNLRSISLNESLYGNMHFVEASEERGVDVAVFSAPLAHRHYMYLYVDMEKDDHQAIMRIDIRNRTHILRSVNILQWHLDNRLDGGFTKVMMPPSAWHCGIGQHVYVTNSQQVPGGKMLMNTLHAVRRLSAGSAILDILTLPADLKINFKDVEAPSFMPTPAHRLLGFLDSAYKHYRFTYQRSEVAGPKKGLKWAGNGELWSYYKYEPSLEGSKGDFMLRIRWTDDMQLKSITMTVDSRTGKLYVFVFDRRDKTKNGCHLYQISDSDAIVKPDELMKYFHRAVVSLDDLEKAFHVTNITGVPKRHIDIAWARDEALQLNFDDQGRFKGLLTWPAIHLRKQPKPEAIKIMKIIGDVDEEDEPPPELSDIFGSPSDECPEVATSLAAMDKDTIAHAVISAAATQDFIYVTKEDAHRHMWPLITLLAASLPGDSAVTIGDPQKTIGMLAAPYKHFTYNFMRAMPGGSGKHFRGSGEMWVWAPTHESPNAVKMRFVGHTSSTRFGKITITCIIDSATEQFHMHFQLVDLRASQCITYPFATQKNIVKQLVTVLRRGEHVVDVENGMPKDFWHIFNWTTRKTLELKFSSLDELQEVVMRHNGRVIKQYNVTGEVQTEEALPPDGRLAFDPPPGCIMYNLVDDPLARMTQLAKTPSNDAKARVSPKAPHLVSAALSDLLTLIARRHDEGLRPSGVLRNPTLLTLFALALPGDIAVMLETPQPPHFGGDVSALKYDYFAETFKFGGVFKSNGTVWLNMTERAFRISGVNRKTIDGTAHVDLIARAESNLANQASPVTMPPEVYCHAVFDRERAPDCVRYDYPTRPKSVGIDPSRSLTRNLQFMEVSSTQGEDCGVFQVQLANQNFMSLWIDMEEEDHHAILRVDIHNKSHLLRTVRVSKWYDEATNFVPELRPPPDWKCHGVSGETPLMALDTSPEKGAAELLDTLYAVRRLPAGSAMVELLGLPGDLEIELKQNDGSGAYIPHPAQKIVNFFNAGYKHLRFSYERQYMKLGQIMKWEGTGELWVWFQDDSQGGESVKIRFRAESNTTELGKLVNTIVVDSKEKVLYANFEEVALRKSQCTSYGFPQTLIASEKLARFMEHDFLELSEAEAIIAKLSASNKFIGNVQLDWTRKKKLDLKFDKDGDFRGMVITHKDFPIKLLRVLGKVESADQPPPEIQATIFSPPAKTCLFRAAVDDPLAQVEMNAPHQKSASLREFLSIISFDAHRHLRQLLSLIVFSLPGDIPMMIEEPRLPPLSSYEDIAFDYNSTVLPGSPSQRKSEGTVWSSERNNHAFHLHGISQPTVEFGRVKVDFIAKANPPEMVWANLELLNGAVQQCVSYVYPSPPVAGSNRINVQKHLAQFRGVDQVQGEECLIFTAALQHDNLLMILWIDPEERDHHAIMKVEVRQVTATSHRTLRSTLITHWRDGEDFGFQLNPLPAWHCGPDNTLHPEIAHFGIERVKKKSNDLLQLLFTLKTMDPFYSLLEVLSLPGDLAFEVDGSAQALEDGLKPGSTLPPWLHNQPTGVPLTPNPDSHSAPFGTISLILALTTFLYALVLFVAMIGIVVGGMSVPVIAIFPAVASALFTLQVAQFPARSRNPSEPIDHLCQFFGWVLPQSPLKTLFVCGLVLAIVSMQRTLTRRHEATKLPSQPNAQCAPHGLTPGAWELRALTFLAFPLAAASTQLIEDVEFFGLVGFAIIGYLAYIAATSLKFVTDVIEDKDVVRVHLPRVAGGAEIYIDRSCTQLRALPAAPLGPACAGFLSTWLASPSWCAAPVVANIEEIEHSGARNARDDVYDVEPDSSSLLCSSASVVQQVQEDSLEELRVEFESRPLLAEGHNADDESQSVPSVQEVEEEIANVLVDRREPILHRPSVVEENHPIKIKTTITYEITVDDLVAGVVCIPWLDCAVPASALRKLEEVCGDITLQVHASQLSGLLTSGKYAACFDWGTKWPWRWPLDISMKVFVGVWLALPISADAFQGPVTLLLHIIVFCFVGTFAYGAFAVQPCSHGIDNISLVVSWTAVTLTLFVQSFGLTLQSIAFLATVSIALALLVLCTIAMFASVAVTSVMLGRLEVQGLQDRFLPRYIVGWGPDSFTNVESEPTIVVESNASAGCGMTPESIGHCKNAVEVILPGPRPALAIVLPAMARPSISHSQLLPSSAARPRNAEVMTTLGDRPRLPVPVHMLFPPRGQWQQSTVTPPVAAMLAPGRPGRLVYFDASENEDQQEWQEVTRKFFDGQSQQLADEAMHLVESSLQEGRATDKLVVIEVLPALAAEFMDERFAAEE